jgi:hypothetical protein
MDCNCGGIISTTHEVMTSAEANEKFPGQRTNIPQGYKKMLVRWGVCNCCTRLGLYINPLVKGEKTRSIFNFVKR